MSSNTHHEREESASSSSHNLAHHSGSSSAEFPRQRAPHTPPQIQLGLDAVALSSGPGFSDFFPWVQQDDSQSMGGDKESNAMEAETMRIAAFEQRDAAHLPRNSLQAPSKIDAATADPTQVSQRLPSSDSQQSGGVAERMRSASQESSTAINEEASVVEEARPAPSLVFDAGHQASMLASSSSSPRQAARPLSPALASHLTPRITTGQQPQDVAPHYAEDSAEQEWSAGGEVLDMFEDDRLPGYQVWRRGAPSSSPIAIRIPRQLMGWKAVLMDASGFDDALLTPDLSKKARRASKVLGKQGWEVRQEALKNSYDFRRGSGIWATMHAGHRLFKHDWHVIVKDGSRYVWRMDRHALALYREEGDEKVGEFCKAVPSSSSQIKHGDRAGKRIGSFRFHGQRSRIIAGRSPDGGIFGMSLALASLVAVFGVRGGHGNVSAAFEPSSDPMRDVLEQQRQDEAVDREQVMLALPRPGFARDAESVLSDTTDEDAGEPTTTRDTVRPSRAGSGQQRLAVPSSGPIPTHTRNESAGFSSKKGRKRFSSFFGRASSSSVLEEESGSMTDSERIARQYRRQSMLFGG